MKTILLVLVLMSAVTGCSDEQQAAAPAAEATKEKEKKNDKTEVDGSASTERSGEDGSTVEDATDDVVDSVSSVAFKLTAENCTDPDLSKVQVGVTFMLCDGTIGTGTYAVPAVLPPPDLTGLISENIKSGVTIHGITGSYAGAAQPDLSNLSAGNVKSGVTIAGVTGSYSGPTPPDLTALTAGNVKAGVVINGVTGTYDNRPADCAANGATGCMATATYQAADLQMLTAGNVKSGVTIAGVLGTYNGATVPNDCTGNGQIGCVSTSTWKSADLTNLTAANVKNGTAIAGVTGTYDNRPADCSSNGQEGCVATSTYKAADLTNLTAGNVKAGVTIAGTAGQFPSATYKLSGADNTADLTSGSFDAKMKSATAFEWFDADGTRYTYQGDADLATASNIKDGVTIFGMLGTLTTVTAPDAWDLRKSTVVGAVTGSANLVCRQRSGTGPAADKCNGESYTDITSNSQTCTSSPSTCVYKDRISGLMFAKSGGAKTWANADSYCSGLTVDGISGWRLAEREELQRAFIQGISFTTSLVVDGTIAYWSSTAGTTGKYAVRILDNGATTDTAATSSTPGTLCVK